MYDIMVSFHLMVFCMIGMTKSTNPHIVFVVIDDLGFSDVGLTGSQIKTPVLDNLANNGVRLDQYYVQSKCSPSRSCFMTGRYPYHTGLQSGVLENPQPTGVYLNETFLPQKLHQKGYATHAVGKWHLGFHHWDYTPSFRGFDSYLGYFSGDQDYYNHMDSGYDMWFQNGTKCGANCSHPAWDVKGQYSTFVFTNRALDIISEHNPQTPLYLYLAYQAVHYPPQAPSAYIKPYNFSQSIRNTFAGMLACLDEQLENVVDKLKQKNMWQNTVLIVTTDNGAPTPACGGFQGGQNGPLRGGKCTLWEGGVRGFAFVHSPLLQKSGYVHSGLMHAVDWFPTICSLSGGCEQNPPGFELDGLNQWTMLSQNASSAHDSLIISIDPHHGGEPYFNGDQHHTAYAAIRQGDWKLIVGDPGGPNIWYCFGPPCEGHIPTPPHPPPSWNISALQLYNVILDPYEQNEISKKHPDLVQSMLSALRKANQSMVPPVGGTFFDPLFDPQLHNNTCSPWYEIPNRTNITDNGAHSTILIPTHTVYDWDNWSGGTGIVRNPIQSLRSGDPLGLSQVTVSHPLVSSQRSIFGVSFNYSYIAGYGGPLGCNFTLFLTNEHQRHILYNSPMLTAYNYTSNHSNYSPPLTVTIENLHIQAVDPIKFLFRFQNNHRNLQLKLSELNISVTWA